jgi:hypothetical protein
MLILNVLFLIGLANAVSIDLEWLNFKTKFHKVYSSFEEELLRKEIWLKKYNYLKQFDESKHSFSIAINEYADLTRKESKNFNRIFETIDAMSTKNTFKNIPNSFDWRDKSVIGPVNNQGVSDDVLHIVALGSFSKKFL